jgi:formyltetrahydrofolate deformylase
VQPSSYVLALSCPDRPGIVRAVSGVLADAGGNITESGQFSDPGTGRFLMRVQADVTLGRDELARQFAPVAEEFAMTWRLDVLGRRMRTLVMVSREAHCLNDLLFRQRSGLLPVEVPAVVSNHEDLRPLAEFYDVPFHHLPVEAGGKAEAEARLLALVEEVDAELVVLARYMQVLSDDLCRSLEGRVINIHHSFLPSFKGARPYHQARERGVKLIGATAHYVTPDLDEGPIIEQDVERVDHTMDVPALRAMGQDIEAQVLARAVRWHAEHRVLLDGTRTVVFR